MLVTKITKYALVSLISSICFSSAYAYRPLGHEDYGGSNIFGTIAIVIAIIVGLAYFAQWAEDKGWSWMVVPLILALLHTCSKMS